jgi:hypothetical protein
MVVRRLPTAGRGLWLLEMKSRFGREPPTTAKPETSRSPKDPLVDMFAHCGTHVRETSKRAYDSVFKDRGSLGAPNLGPVTIVTGAQTVKRPVYVSETFATLEDGVWRLAF